MRPYLPLNLLLLLALGCCLTGQGQSNLIKKTLYFSSGQYRAVPAAIADWAGFHDSSVAILVEGHADSRGSRVTNQHLSRMRAQSVKACLVGLGFSPEQVVVRAWGAVLPVASNRTAAGRQKNRRVEISLSRAVPVEVPDIAILYRQLATPLQRFCIDSRRDTILRCKQGTIVYIKANSLKAPPDCDSSCISFNVREDRLYSDMILDDLSTTSDGALLQTQGMIYAEAIDCQGRPVTLQKDMVILMPTDVINPGAGIFSGNRGVDGIMNWTRDTGARLSGITLPDLDICAEPEIKFDDPMKKGQPQRCPLFFCKIGRLFRGRPKEQPVAPVSPPPADTSVQRTDTALRRMKCVEVAELFRSYIDGNPEPLMRAINQPLLDLLGVSSIPRLKDTLSRMVTKNIALAYKNKTLSFDNFKYYIYNTSRLGWHNIDCFQNIRPADQVTVKVRLSPAKNITCKLVFTSRGIVMPPSRKSDQFEFQGTPRGEKAVAIAIKYEEGKPFLAMKEIVVGSTTAIDMEWRSVTLEELQQELRRLDR